MGWSLSSAAVVSLFAAYLLYTGVTLRLFFVPKSAAAGEPCYTNAFHEQAASPSIDVRVYVSTSQTFTRAVRANAPVWQLLGAHYNRAGMEAHAAEVSVSLSDNVQAGRSMLYAHAVVTPAGSDGLSLTQLGEAEEPPWSLHARTSLVRKLPVPPPSLKFNLLFGTRPTPPAPVPGPVPMRAHWLPALRIQMVQDRTCYPLGGVPGDVAHHYQFLRGHRYVPALAIDEFHVRNSQLAPLLGNLSTPLLVSVAPVSIGWWRLYTHLSRGLANLDTTMGADEQDTDDLRRMFTETSPVLLVVTMLVSLLHLLFDVLAFKSDVAFWRQRRSADGLSARAIAYSAFCQLVVLLYLTENESSALVRFSVALGLAMECWKLGCMWLMPAHTGAAAAQTQRADEAAGRWLLTLLSPLIVSYAAYSLVYEEHTGWYGWVVSSLYGFVFALGFVAMTPQLFVNYRLKSVENMAWRTLVYRALNTFIDDLFAFIITMPTLHRLSCFRDDIVFFVFLFQRWSYPTDPSRHLGHEQQPSAQPAPKAKKAKKDE